jgi:hypothetical protein
MNQREGRNATIQGELDGRTQHGNSPTSLQFKKACGKHARASFPIIEHHNSTPPWTSERERGERREGERRCRGGCERRKKESV